MKHGGSEGASDGVIVESIADLSKIPGYTGKVDDT